MKHRATRPAFGIVVIMATTIAVVSQAASKPSRPAGATSVYTPGRTPDGQPDLQGFWTNSTYTPLERPDSVTKEFYTPEEAAAIETKAAAGEGEQTKPGTIADVHYDFTQFGLDRNQSTLAHNLRTSLIVNPESGKLPPLTAEGQRRAAERAEAARHVGRWDAAQTNQLDDRCLIMGGAGPC